MLRTPPALPTALALRLQGRCAPPCSGLSGSMPCPGWDWGAVRTPKHFNISFGSVLQIKAVKKEEMISIPAKKLLIFHLGKVCLLGQKKGPLFLLWFSKPDCSSNSTPVASSCANTSHWGKTGRTLYSTSYHSSLWPPSLKKMLKRLTSRGVGDTQQFCLVLSFTGNWSYHRLPL